MEQIKTVGDLITALQSYDPNYLILQSCPAELEYRYFSIDTPIETLVTPDFRHFLGLKGGTLTDKTVPAVIIFHKSI